MGKAYGAEDFDGDVYLKSGTRTLEERLELFTGVMAAKMKSTSKKHPDNDVVALKDYSTLLIDDGIAYHLGKEFKEWKDEHDSLVATLFDSGTSFEKQKELIRREMDELVDIANMAYIRREALRDLSLKERWF